MNNVSNIFQLHNDKTFTHSEAEELIPLLNSISLKTNKSINELNSQLSFLKKTDPKAEKLSMEVNEMMMKWSEKVRRLGGLPITMGQVKFPSNQGELVWEYPNTSILPQ